MNTFRSELQDLVSRHVARAPLERVLALVDSLDATPAARPVAASGPRYVNLGADGNPVAVGDPDWVAVYDTQTQLTWTRQCLDCGPVTHADALAAASAVRLFGRDDWRAPTIQEQLSIIDYTRCDPALDTTHFDGPADWCWTSTIAAAPAGCAWYVFLYDGFSSRDFRSDRLRVRAVRAGQSLPLGI